MCSGCQPSICFPIITIIVKPLLVSNDSLRTVFSLSAGLDLQQHLPSRIFLVLHILFFLMLSVNCQTCLQETASSLLVFLCFFWDIGSNILIHNIYIYICFFFTHTNIIRLVYYHIGSFRTFSTFSDKLVLFFAFPWYSKHSVKILFCLISYKIYQVWLFSAPGRKWQFYTPPLSVRLHLAHKERLQSQ